MAGWCACTRPAPASRPDSWSRSLRWRERYGNGLVEISARANLQLRGVSALTHPDLVEALLQERLVDEPERDGPQRLVLSSPLLPRPGAKAGLNFGDLIDAAALARDLEMAGREMAGLPAKFSIVVDGGGRLALDDIPCDLRLVGVAPGHLVIGLPHGLWFGPLAPEAGLAAALALLQGFASLRQQAPELRRLRDCSAGQLSEMIARPACAAPVQRPSPARAGLFAAASGDFAAMIALPFGRCQASTLARLGEAAAEAGGEVIRLTPWRGLACLGLDEDGARRWLDGAAALGLVTADADPRLGIQACAGKPACLRAETDAMGDAAVLAERLAPLLADGLSLHVSACIKSCAHPAAADLTLVGAGGGYDLVMSGATRDQSIARLDLPAILRATAPRTGFVQPARARPSGPACVDHAL